MNLGYCKHRIKEYFGQAVLHYKLRRKGNIIKGSSFISPGTILAGNNIIGSFARIGEEVVIERNCRVGDYASISKLTLGENSRIESGVKCTGSGSGRIIVGKESYVGINNILDWSDHIIIGNFVHIAGPSTGLWTHSSAAMCQNSIPLSNHSTNYRPVDQIIIEDNVYIGGNSIIYPGVRIGHHSIVAPNSAVNSDVKPFTLVGGVPAKFIKTIEIK